ncbi:MAG TPA: NHLP bacteriocin system secretion protein [Candidatus Angelobacter sp.]
MSIFRQASLDRLSSPEELDELMHLTNIRSWLALFGIFLLLTTVVVWAFEGSIPMTVAGEGAIVRRGGVMNIVSRSEGVLLELNVQVGDHVKRGQVVARVAQPATTEKLQLLRKTLDEARNERATMLRLYSEQSSLQVAAVKREIENAEQQIERLQKQAKLATAQIQIEDDLLAKGLVTRQQTVLARQKLAELESQMADRQAAIKQLEAQRFSFQAKPVETDAERQTNIHNLERDLAELQQQFEISSSVVTPNDGEVVELKAYPGGTVSAQTPILSIQPEVNNLRILAYVPSARAKAIRQGMEAQVSPSIVRREEYGYIRAKVVQVADYPSTKAALMRNFENENLTAALANAGPVTEVQIEMTSDESTPTGFRWSSSKGPMIILSAGTLCSVQIVTSRQKPIALVMPFLRQEFGMQ